MEECLNYKKIDSQTLQCQTCNHFCEIKEGRVGICGIRQNIGGKLYLLAYGKATAAHVDPIEKKPFFHFLPGSFAYSFAAIGCNFRCKNCQNYDISQMFGLKGRVGEYGKLNWGYFLSPKKIVEEALKNQCQSIAYTYTEPTVFMEYALDTMKLAKEKGLKNVWVSNGFMSDKTLDEIIPYLDAINIDIKSFNDDFYKSNCGAGVQPILNNCKRLAREKIWLETTTLVIPTLSDNEEMLRQIAGFIKNELGDFVPWHISAFSGEISWKLQNIPDTPIKTIKNACQIGEEEGLKYVYGGNVPGSGMENTYCPKCGNIIIKRDNYYISRQDKKGNCPKCGENIIKFY
ncbi:AmmeMemoRadiSam system radical SAM enzyme [Candidatus Parcubacteria bacterium]|nr:AmmeMemoRadiSam system radical SAM enzyme [Candidatus Parcubacteria bacterium]